MRARSIFLLAFACVSTTGFGQDLFVSSEGTNSVKRYHGTTGAYLGDFVTPGSGGLDRPQGISFGPDGNLYVSSVASGRVLRYQGQTGAFMGAFTQGAPMGFAADMDWRGGFLYVSDFQFNGHVNKYDATTGAFIEQFTMDNFRGADGIVWDAVGNMYVSSFGNNTVRKYSAAGAYLGDFASGGGLAGPLDLRWGADGDLFVNSFGTGSVKRYDGVTGVFEGDFITGLGTTQGQTVGPDGSLFVGSYNGSFIKRYNATTGADMGVFASGGGLLRPNNFVFMPVPEPASAAVLAAGLALVARRRRSRRQA